MSTPCISTVDAEYSSYPTVYPQVKTQQMGVTYAGRTVDLISTRNAYGSDFALNLLATGMDWDQILSEDS